MNIITTIVCMRAPGMTLHRMPLFVWAMLMQSIIIVLCIPVLAGGLSARYPSPLTVPPTRDYRQASDELRPQRLHLGACELP